MTRFQQAPDLMQRGSLYVLLFLLPFSKAAIEIASVFLFVGWIWQRIDPRTRSDTLWVSRRLRPLTLALAGFLGVCALSIAVSDYPLLGIRALFSKWSQYLLLFVVLADVLRDRAVVRRSIVVLVWSSVFVIVEALAQELWGSGIFRGHKIGPSWYPQQITGPYENPIDLGTYLMMIIPVLVAYARGCRGFHSWGVWGVVVALVACLARTGAFGAWLGLGVGLVVVIVVNKAIRRSASIFLAVLVLVCVFNLQWTGRLSEVTSLAEAGKVDRLFMWQAAIGMIRDRPFLGHGLNTFMANYLDYWVGGERQPRYAHNCYLQVAAETGIVGLLLFVTLLGLLFARLAAMLRRVRFDENALLSGAVVGLVAFSVQAAIDTNFYALRQAALFWVIAGLAIGLSMQEAKSSSTRSG